MILFAGRLDEQQVRWYAAVEAENRGFGGQREVADILCIDPKTIRRGIEELEAGFADRPTDRIRAPGGGRKPVEKKHRR